MSQHDYQKMAGAFLNLWQEQLTRSMTDRDFVRNMMDMMQRMQQDSMSAFSHQKGHEQSQKHRHAAPASEPRDGELAQLAQRLADCERRIAKLEAELRQTVKPKAKPVSRSTKAKPKTSAKGKTARSGSGAAKPASAAKRPAAKPAQKKTKKITIKRAVKRKT